MGVYERGFCEKDGRIQTKKGMIGLWINVVLGVIIR